MKFDLLTNAHVLNSRNLRSVVAAVAMLCTTPAFAQITKVQTVMTNVQNMLAGVAVTIFSIAFMRAGYLMGFQHAKWSEVSNIVIGGIMVGGATGLASWLVA